MTRVVLTSKLALDWLHKSEQPIRSQDSKLSQCLTMTTTHKIPLEEKEAEDEEEEEEEGGSETEQAFRIL